MSPLALIAGPRSCKCWWPYLPLRSMVHLPVASSLPFCFHSMRALSRLGGKAAHFDPATEVVAVRRRACFNQRRTLASSRITGGLCSRPAGNFPVGGAARARDGTTNASTPTLNDFMNTPPRFKAPERSAVAAAPASVLWRLAQPAARAQVLSAPRCPWPYSTKPMLSRNAAAETKSEV